LKNELKLEVAHNLISLRLSDPLFFTHVAQSYRGFLSDGNPKVVIETQIVDSIPQTPSKGGRVIFTKRGMKISGISFGGRVDLAKAKGDLYTTAEWLLFSLKVFLRYVFILLHICEGDGLVLHALGVLKEGEVYVFFGPSGSGKTTAATLSKGHTILRSSSSLKWNHTSFIPHLPGAICRAGRGKIAPTLSRRYSNW